ncbi:MAG: DUF58 domain-containing protein [Treponema sp.]|jgi:hypothetical protein|nr:DUF58 domain-containing protein [Treponema sp.]
MQRAGAFLKKIIFTPVGFAVLVIAFIMLIRSLLARNAYEIVLSCTALLFFLALGIIGSWRARKLSEMEPGWKPPYPITASAGKDTVISGLNADIPLFFRLHFVASGKFFPSASSVFSTVKNEISVPRGESSINMQMDFPMSGIFRGEGACRLRDIFGFFSFPCGHTLQRTFNIRSAPCFGKDYFINAQSGAEDRRNKHSTDEERYYMREYTPGDRFRDINWKSSEKIDTLITRISPDNQEKVSRIQIYFRNFGGNTKPSLEELWLLDRAKARLAHFLHKLKEQQSSFVFDIRSGCNGSWEIEDEEDLDEFLEKLSCLTFVPPQNETSVITGAKNSEVYVFSTACDTGLPSFLLASNPRPVTLFITQTNQIAKNANTKDVEYFYKRNLLLNGCIPLPGQFIRWLFRSKIKPMNVQTAKTAINYAGTML